MFILKPNEMLYIFKNIFLKHHNTGSDILQGHLVV